MSQQSIQTLLLRAMGDDSFRERLAQGAVHDPEALLTEAESCMVQRLAGKIQCYRAADLRALVPSDLWDAWRTDARRAS
jgi:hypothetical protein